MAILSVNIDHIATLRQARKHVYPSLFTAAILCEKAGADGITVHLREDRRHTQDKDVEILKEVVIGEFNLEMAPTEEIVNFACKIKPDSVCIVPEKRQELTTEGGLNVKTSFNNLKKIIPKLQKHGIKVSIFIEPDIDQIKLIKKLGANMCELHTGIYANSTEEEKKIILEKIFTASNFAYNAKLEVNVGHGLDIWNVPQLTNNPLIRGYYIGFSIIARSVFLGLESAVKEILQIIKK